MLSVVSVFLPDLLNTAYFPADAFCTWCKLKNPGVFMEKNNLISQRRNWSKQNHNKLSWWWLLGSYSFPNLQHKRKTYFICFASQEGNVATRLCALKVGILNCDEELMYIYRCLSVYIGDTFPFPPIPKLHMNLNSILPGCHIFSHVSFFTALFIYRPSQYLILRNIEESVKTHLTPFHPLKG